MAYNYGNNYQNHHLKPMSLVDNSSLYSTHSDGSYNPVSPGLYDDNDLQRLETRDAALKYRIRLLRVISRVIATIISAATLAPLTMTLVRFFETRNEYFTVDGEQRTAWASGTIAWYTYMYFAVSAISFILNTVILISYCRGVKKANAADKAAGIWSGVIMVAHVIIWAVSVVIYRYGKEPVDGSFKDLWGWTCSTAADEIQSQVTNIDYAQYCTVQVSKDLVSTRSEITGSNYKHRLRHSTPVLRMLSRVY